MRYIGIDIGSSFIKSALLDIESCRIIDQHKLPAPKRLKLDTNNKFEVPAEQFVNIAKDLVDKYTKKYTKIKGILLSTQMHGFIYSTENSPDIYISWQDSRCLSRVQNSNESYMANLQNLFSKEEMKNCGVYIKPSLGLCNLYTLLNSDKTIKRDGELYTLGSYIISKLTNNNICHITNAAPLGIADVIKFKWDKKIIEKAGFEYIKLPRIAKSDFEVCGSYSSNGQELKVFPDFGDQQTAILGSMAGKKDIVINIATASQISRINDYFIPGEFEIRPYFEKRYINTISNMPAGRNLDVLIRFIKLTIKQVTEKHICTDDIWKCICDMYYPYSNGLKVDMGFYSTPNNLNGGSISGITSTNFELKYLFAAAFEDIAQTYYNNINILCNNNKSIDKLICAGGVSWKLPQLLDTISRITGYKCILSPIQDEVFSGLFRIALVCGDICDNLKDSKEITLKMEGDSNYDRVKE